MKNKQPESEIRSDYDRNEHFTLNNIPKHFDSVTNESLARLKRSIIEKVENDTSLKPGALQAALKGVDGQFEEAYSTLEGDYSARKTKLQTAYTQGISDVRRAFKNYELQVEEHNIAFRNYSNANKAINGEPLSDRLMISQDEVKKLKEAINNL